MHEYAYVVYVHIHKHTYVSSFFGGRVITELVQEMGGANTVLRGVAPVELHHIPLCLQSISGPEMGKGREICMYVHTCTYDCTYTCVPSTLTT